MIKSFLYTISLVIITAVFMILTIVAFEGIILHNLTFLIIFPIMTLVGTILMIYHANQMWWKIAKWIEGNQVDDCPHVMHSRHSKDAHEMLEEYLKDNDLK